jgi:3-oxoacyl-[acyl-carrier protein] reductase
MVVVHGRDTKAMSSVQAEIERSGGKAMHAAADITKFGEIESMRHQIEETLGPVDILVANAGENLVMPGPLEEIGEEGWHATVDVNLTATFLTLKSFLPGMKEWKAGSIITISSAAARRPTPRSPIPYTASKAGIQILTQIVAAQVGPYGIRANSIAPETILTERNQQRIPMNRNRCSWTCTDQTPGIPEDVARAALFLLDGSLDQRNPGCSWWICSGLIRAEDIGEQRTNGAPLLPLRL